MSGALCPKHVVLMTHDSGLRTQDSSLMTHHLSLVTCHSSLFTVLETFPSPRTYIFEGSILNFTPARS